MKLYILVFLWAGEIASVAAYATEEDADNAYSWFDDEFGDIEGLEVKRHETML